jgi:carbamoyl-phosphate synthase small subunit
MTTENKKNKSRPSMKGEIAPARGEAVLALESGKIFHGEAFGAEGERLGEVVFNTSMTGYQEILTDPSYKGQIIVMTAPHIGNIGTNDEDAESLRIFAEGFVVRESSAVHSSWRSSNSLDDLLKERKIPGIAGIDTRMLTKHIRDYGAMRGIISTVDFDHGSLMKKVLASPSMSGQDLAKEVTCKEPYGWFETEWKWTEEHPEAPVPAPLFNVVVIDYGVKHNILRCLADRGCNVTVVPAATSAKEILEIKPDGVMLSNGPGDPAAVTYGIETVRRLIEAKLPIFGICLGNQILGLALGGKTYKLKFGHRGVNHPVKDLLTGKIEITTQNHGFCVDMDSLKDKDVEVSHINLNDRTVEGIRHRTLPVFSVQYHPESSGGPHDSRYLFDRFIDLMKKAK